MKPIKLLVGLSKGYYTEGLYGVEIEVEGKRLPTDRHLASSAWRVETDGSLKAEEAYEYVMPKPRNLKGVKDSLEYLQNAYSNRETEVDESIRAGVHVHMNVQDWNMNELITFSTIYYMLEDILLKYCGENREGNLFCLRTRDAEYVLFRLYKALKERNLKYLKEDVIRYSSLNFCSLFKYGSIEFRGMRGTGDLDAIYEWVEIIDELRTQSLKFESPVEVMGMLSGDGEINFLNRVLPTKAHLFDKDGIEESIRSATRRVQMIAFGVDWAKLNKPNVNIFNQEGF